MQRHLFLFLSSWLINLMVLLAIILWVVITVNAGNFSEAQLEYQSYFPTFLQKPGNISFLSIGLLFLAVGCLGYLLNKSYRKGLTITGFVLALILLGMNLWSIM